MKNIGKITFIGAGRMAGAIAGGLVESGFAAENMAACDVSKQAAEAFSKKTGIKVYTDSCRAALADSEIVIIAVKPQHLAAAIMTLKSSINTQLIISIAAGVTLARLAELTGSRRLIRVMPNTPALVGAGVSAYTIDEGASKSDAETAESILGAVGQVVQVDEKLMDAVTGLSGSGPAYVFDFIQALADGGVHEGLPRDTALKLAVQTVLGAAELVQKTGEHPTALRDMVTSPGGTTARALSVLDKGAFRGLVADAVIAASRRSKELGK
jgi:pyrroline-5-carboxylate reductase